MNSNTEPSSPADSKVAQLYYSGPLPSAEVLKQYEEISPGFTSRLLELTEQQSLHRQRLEESIDRASSRFRYLGFGVAALLTAGIVVFGVLTEVAPTGVTVLLAAIAGYVLRSASNFGGTRKP